jgi:hypothetical protein
VEQEDLQYELRILNIRCGQNSNVLAVRGYSVGRGVDSLCRGNAVILVLVEPVLDSLANYTGLAEREAALMLNEALVGCKTLFSIFKCYFQVTAEAIMLTADSQVRVWLQPDPVASRPLPCGLAPAEPEHQLVADLIELVEERTLGRRFSARFERQVLDKLSHPLCFGRVLWLLGEFLAFEGFVRG